MTGPDKPSGGTPTHQSEAYPGGEGAAGGEAGSPPWQRVTQEGGSDGFGGGELSPHTGNIPGVDGAAGQGGAPDGVSNAEQGTDYLPQPERDKPPRDVEGVTLSTRGRASSSSAPSALRRPGRGPRRASLMVKRIDPWSVLKLSLVLGVAMFLVWMVAVGLLYIVLDGMGVWDKLNGTYTSLVSGANADAVAEPLISAGRVFGVAAIIGMVNIVLLSALATVSAFIYNVSADLAGGLEITLSERD